MAKQQKTNEPNFEMPFNLAAEHEALALLLKFPNARADIIVKLQEKFFHDLDCRNAFIAICLLFNEKKAIDSVSLISEMKQLGSQAKYDFVEKLNNVKVTTPKFKTILEGLTTAFDARETTKQCLEILQIAQSGKISKSEILGFTNRISEIVNEISEEQYKTVSFNDALVAMHEDSMNLIQSLKTGFYAIDDELCILKGALTILAARPSMGKTALALSIMVGLARNQQSCLFVSIETKKQNLVRRIASDVANIKHNDLRDVKYYRENNAKIMAEIMQNSNSFEKHIFLNDRTIISIEQIRNYIELKNRELKIENREPLSCIFVDYLQLVSSEKTNKVREQEVAQISKGLKAIAKDFNVAVVALSQVSRDVAKSGDKKPQLADLRESGSIESDADVVLFLHRPEYYNIMEDENGESTAGLAEIIIAKNKDGNRCTRQMQFEGEYQRFLNKGAKVFLTSNIDDNFEI